MSNQLGDLVNKLRPSQKTLTFAIASPQCFCKPNLRTIYLDFLSLDMTLGNTNEEFFFLQNSHLIKFIKRGSYIKCVL